STYCVFMFYVMCSTYCVCMFLCLLYAPIHQNKFQVGVNLLGNKYYSDSDSDSDIFTQTNHPQTVTTSYTMFSSVPLTMVSLTDIYKIIQSFATWDIVLGARLLMLR